MNTSARPVEDSALKLVVLLFCYVLFFCACNAAAHAVTPFWTLLPGFVSVRVGARMDDDAVKMRHMLTLT